MTSDQKTDFAIWYRSVRRKKFDFQKQLRRYCVNDVRILYTACGIYRENFIECATIDPLAYATLASACMATFKKSFLKKKTLGIDLRGGLSEKAKVVLMCIHPVG